MTSVICPECYSEKLKWDYQKSELVCIDCGLVINAADPEYINGIKVVHPINDALIKAKQLEKILKSDANITKNLDIDYFDYIPPLNKAPAK